MLGPYSRLVETPYLISLLYSLYVIYITSQNYFMLYLKISSLKSALPFNKVDITFKDIFENRLNHYSGTVFWNGFIVFIFHVAETTICCFSIVLFISETSSNFHI